MTLLDAPLSNLIMADQENPFVQWTQEHPFGWHVVLESVRAGLTRRKDTYFQLYADSDKVVVCNSDVLRKALLHETNHIVHRFLDTLDARDPDRNEQIIHLSLGGDKGFFVLKLILPIAVNEQPHEENKI